MRKALVRRIRHRRVALTTLTVTCLCLMWGLPATTDEAREAGASGVASDQGPNRATDEPIFPVPPSRTTPTPSPRKGSNIPEGKLPDLDALLQLPTNFVREEPRAVAGAGESVWRKRFEKADRELSEARIQLSDTKRELEGVAVTGGGSQWSIAAPGGGSGGGGGGFGGANTGVVNGNPNTSPLSFRLRQQLRGDRERVTKTERARRELQIEADLAGVPQRWRGDLEDTAGPTLN